MGIGNRLPCWPSTPGDLILITPHGDRKRAVVDPVLGRPYDLGSSLPLMGIENYRHQTAAMKPRLRTCGRSLPLMGIENICLPEFDKADRQPSSSLPLMGIENLKSDSPRAASPAPSSSLPLMGIENAEPRGDRSSSRGIHAHYPSWGSENGWLTCGRTASVAPSTHYPSWGSKTRSGRPIRSTNSTTLASLPLMGIENPSILTIERRPVPSCSLPLMWDRSNRALFRVFSTLDASETTQNSKL